MDVTDEELVKIVYENVPETEREEMDIRGRVGEELTKIERILKKLPGKISLLRDAVTDLSDFGKAAGVYTKSIGKDARKILNSIDYIGRTAGGMSAEEIKRIPAVPLVFEKYEERLHIVFPDLIPKRIKSDSVLTHRDIRAMYAPAFADFFSSGKHKVYEEKAVIVFTHIYKANERLIDHDNFETKPITDLITSRLLTDDSPVFCAVFSDYRVGEYTHTEVDVLPFSEFPAFLTDRRTS